MHYFFHNHFFFFFFNPTSFESYKENAHIARGFTLVACKSTVSRKSCRLSSSKASTSCWIKERSGEKMFRLHNRYHRYNLTTGRGKNPGKSWCDTVEQYIKGYFHCRFVWRSRSWSCPRILSVCSGLPPADTSASWSLRSWTKTFSSQMGFMSPQ